MATSIFVNLPVKDLSRSIAFFEALGYEFNKQFTDDNAACLVIDENIFAMLLTEQFFKGFTQQEIADTAAVNEALIALSADSREAVDTLVDKALAAGGKAHGDATDEGFMYGRGFTDPDGHVWNIMWMDQSAIEG
ncbi:VOC family protein [Streptomyces sp. A7024]|uniref:VOC family protein n=1 Tax=Streptomyces coryli TaxID=1128680 RepID=A0A6G4U5L9_9ACTN|nr:VOC family protein [Streptomyces coryli]NGN67302.1 VOC family protein [Streptomyces coryli]